MTASSKPLPSPSPGSRAWPISIIAFFGVFLSGLIAFIIFATHQRVDLVRPDYYDQEIRYQTQLDKINRALSVPHPAEVRFDAAGRRILIQLPPDHVPGSSGQVHLYRPADARLDLEFPLALDAKGVQDFDASRLRAGLWKVRVEWSAGGRDYFVSNPLLCRAPESATP